MNARARRRALLGWLPRGLLVLTALLAPVIDRGVDEVARAGASEAPQQAETVRG